MISSSRVRSAPRPTPITASCPPRPVGIGWHSTCPCRTAASRCGSTSTAFIATARSGSTATSSAATPAATPASAMTSLAGPIAAGGMCWPFTSIRGTSRAGGTRAAASTGTSGSNVADPVHLAPWGTFVTAQLSDSPLRPAAMRPGLPSRLPSATRQSRGRGNARLAGAGCRRADVATATTPVTVPAASKEWETSQIGVVPRAASLVAGNAVSVPRGHDGPAGRDSRSTATRLPFGIRTIRYDADRGFFLNGKPVKIQGTCNHQDFVGVGIGVPDGLRVLARAAAPADGRQRLADVAQPADARAVGRLRPAGHARHGRKPPPGRFRAEPGRGRRA